MMVLQPVHFALVFSQLGGNPQNHLFLHLVSGSDIKAQPALAQGVKLQFNLLPVWLFQRLVLCGDDGVMVKALTMICTYMLMIGKMLSASGGWVCIEQL